MRLHFEGEQLHKEFTWKDPMQNPTWENVFYTEEKWLKFYSLKPYNLDDGSDYFVSWLVFGWLESGGWNYANWILLENWLLLLKWELWKNFLSYYFLWLDPYHYSKKSKIIVKGGSEYYLRWPSSTTFSCLWFDIKEWFNPLAPNSEETVLLTRRILGYFASKMMYLVEEGLFDKQDLFGKKDQYNTLAEIGIFSEAVCKITFLN